MNSAESMIPWQWLAEKSGPAFVIAGLLVLIAPTAGVLGAPQALTVPVSLLANLATIIALLGLYPWLADLAGDWAKGGLVAAGLALLAFIATIALNVAAALASGSGTTLVEGATGTQVLLLAIVMTAVLSFILYAIAALRHGGLPDPGGLLLLAAGLLWLLAISAGIVLQDSPIVAAVLLGVNGLAQITLGAQLILNQGEMQPA